MRQIRFWIVGLAVVLFGCTGGAAGGDDFVLADGSITGPAAIEGAGLTTFEITNVGEFNHTLVVTDREGAVVAATDLVAPGEAVSLQVDLSAGQYLVSCRLVTQDGEGNIIDHYELGMYKTISVGG